MEPVPQFGSLGPPNGGPWIDSTVPVFSVPINSQAAPKERARTKQPPVEQDKDEENQERKRSRSRSPTKAPLTPNEILTHNLGWNVVDQAPRGSCSKLESC